MRPLCVRAETAYPYTAQEYCTADGGWPGTVASLDAEDESPDFGKKTISKAGYERLFAQTKVEVEDVVVEETEYEENFDASKVTSVYDGNEEQLPGEW